MTRINLVNPSELSAQHLVAEYREIFMVGSALKRSKKSKKWEQTKLNLPKDFTLNVGHVKFFYNKGKYLHKRYEAIVDEMKRRGMKPDPNRIFKKEQWSNDLYQDWHPKDRDLQIIRERIKERISKKAHWYRWTNRVSKLN